MRTEITSKARAVVALPRQYRIHTIADAEEEDNCENGGAQKEDNINIVSGTAVSSDEGYLFMCSKATLQDCHSHKLLQ